MQEKREKSGPFIESKEIFKALAFAKKMISENGDTDYFACKKAANYYKVPLPDVAMELLRFRDWEKNGDSWKGKNVSKEPITDTSVTDTSVKNFGRNEWGQSNRREAIF